MEDEKTVELATMLEGMSPPIADLLRRMMEDDGLTWEGARAYRDEIVELNHTARTDEEQSALLFAFKALMDRVENLGLIDGQSLEKFRGARKGDYMMMLGVQATIGELIDPERLDYVTRREVEAGRLAANDDFREFAVAGATVLGKLPDPPKARNWLGRLFRRD